MEFSYFAKKIDEFGQQFGSKKFYTGKRSVLIFKLVKDLTNGQFEQICDQLIGTSRFSPNVEEFRKEVMNIKQRQVHEKGLDQEELKNKARSEMQRENFRTIENIIVEKIGLQKYEETLKKMHNRINICFSFKSEEFRRLVVKSLEENKLDWKKALEELQAIFGENKRSPINNLIFF